MTPAYQSYIQEAKEIATARGLKWDIPCNAEGMIADDERWNLTALVRAPLPAVYISNFGFEQSRVKHLNEIMKIAGLPHYTVGQLVGEWRDLYLAVVIKGVFVDRKKPRTVMTTARSIRDLALTAGNIPPWKVSPDLVRHTYNSLLLVGESGKVADLYRSSIAMLDDDRIAEIPNLVRHCTPLNRKHLRDAHEVCISHLALATERNRVTSVRKRLSDRKSSSKLPGESAFWEAVRISFTEHPQTFVDRVRFAVIKLAVITGLRITEIVTLPLKWEKLTEYVDADGAAAGLKGGISSAMSLRYFAEKTDNNTQLQDSHCLCEAFQYIPSMFEKVVKDTLEDIKVITAPLRETMRAQYESKRLFPHLPDTALVPAHDMYTMVSGNAYLSSPDLYDAALDAEYRRSFRPEVLEEIRESQLSGSPTFSNAAKFWMKRKSVPIRDELGDVMHDVVWSKAYVRVCDVEDYINSSTPEKKVDMQALMLADGTEVPPHNLMFIVPYRALLEGRYGGIIDTTRYIAARPISQKNVSVYLDGRRTDSIFQRYGQDEIAKALKIEPHEFRHLQNAELFRLGVSDTVITQRFNRSTVSQSHVYDHRSLAEDLQAMSLPIEAREALSESAREVYALVRNNKVSGPLIDEFKNIQAQDGDDAAFDFLNAEADGLHVTPYGFCVSSFVVDPCPKHLECFNGCRNLARSDVAEERVHLQRLLERISSTLSTLESLPEDKRPIGWQNQLKHARVTQENIRKSLATRPGDRPFPDGPDLYQSAQDRLGSTLLDRRL